jgi:hypothetical protein
MYVDPWIIVFSLLGGVLLVLAAAFFPLRRPYLAMPALILFLVSWYEIRMDRWEKTVTAPIRLDVFVEILLMILCLIFGAWQIALSRKTQGRFRATPSNSAALRNSSSKEGCNRRSKITPSHGLELLT